MRLSSLLSALLILPALTFGCALDDDGDSPAPGDAADGGSTPDDDGSEPDGPPPTLEIDTRGTSGLVPLADESWTVTGTVEASEGPAHLTVAGEDVPLSEGAFETSVPVDPGLSLVEILAEDSSDPPFTRYGHRSVLRAEFLPEGDINPNASSLVLNDTMVQGLAEAHAERVAELDITPLIMERDPLLEEDGCVIHPDDASHDAPQLSGFVENGELILETRVPNLEILFSGVCKRVGFVRIGVHGHVRTDVVLRTALSLEPQDTCAETVDHTEPEVRLEGFEMDVSGNDFVQNLLVDLFGGDHSGSTESRLVEDFATEGDGLYAAQLAAQPLFFVEDHLELFGHEVDRTLCLTGLVSDGENVRALIGGAAAGDGTREAPGAALQPYAEATPVAPDVLRLDPGFLSQMLYAAWRENALEKENASEVSVGMLALLAPSLKDHFETDTPVAVHLRSPMMPHVRGAAPGSEADAIIEVGGMRLELEAEGERLFTFGAQLTFTISFVPDGHGVRPELVDLDTEVWLLEEPVVDVDDDTLAEAVALRIPETAEAFLSGGTVPLPDMPGLGTPMDVIPTAEGNIDILLHGAETPEEPGPE